MVVHLVRISYFLKYTFFQKFILFKLNTIVTFESAFFSGMERKDLLSANVKIFKVQGEALDKHAKKDVKVLVVGNPANTNALICSKYAPSIPKENFTAMTRLDQNRAQAQIADKVGTSIGNVSHKLLL